MGFRTLAETDFGVNLSCKCKTSIFERLGLNFADWLTVGGKSVNILSVKPILSIFTYIMPTLVKKLTKLKSPWNNYLPRQVAKTMGFCTRVWSTTHLPFSEPTDHGFSQPPLYTPKGEKGGHITRSIDFALWCTWKCVRHQPTDIPTCKTRGSKQISKVYLGLSIQCKPLLDLVWIWAYLLII